MPETTTDDREPPTTRDLELLARVRQQCASGEALKIRQRSKLSQAEVGGAVGCSAAAISRWEHGRRRPTGRAGVAYAHLIRRLDGIGSSC